jgi:hypothetical protein
MFKFTVTPSLWYLTNTGQSKKCANVNKNVYTEAVADFCFISSDTMLPTLLQKPLNIYY